MYDDIKRLMLAHMAYESMDNAASTIAIYKGPNTGSNSWYPNINNIAEVYDLNLDSFAAIYFALWDDVDEKYKNVIIVYNGSVFSSEKISNLIDINKTIKIEDL